MTITPQKKYRILLGFLDQNGYVIHINRVKEKRYELQVNWEIKKQYRKRDSCNKFILKLHKKVTTMAKEKTVAEIVEMPINLIFPDHNNPRANYEEESCIELAKSIKQHGLLQPIMIRPMSGIEPLKYVVVYGHRRLWAVKLLKWETIPVQVKELTEDEAFEFQIIENLQRVDINPMDESDSFQKLVKKGMFNAEIIADKIGKSPKYVYDRLILQDVIPAMQSAVRVGKFTISHAKQLAKITPEDQNRLWQVISNKNSAEIEPAYIRRLINDTFKLKIGEAIFPTGDSQLKPAAGSCLACKKRSGARQLLFDDYQEDDVCFDLDCWKEKETAFIDRLIEKYKAEGKEVKLLTSISYGTNNPLLLQTSQWHDRELLDGEPDSNTIGIIVDIPKWQQNKYFVGQIVRLSDFEIVEEIKESNNVNETPSRSTTNNSNPSTPQIATVYLMNEMRLKLLENLHILLLDGYINEQSLMTNAIKYVMQNSMEYSYPFFENVCKQFGWEKLENGNGFDWVENTKGKLIDNHTHPKQLFILMAMLQSIDINWFDKDDIEMIDSFFPELKVYGVAEEISVLAGRKMFQ